MCSQLQSFQVTLVSFTGLSPTDPWDEAVADQICGGVDDLRLSFIKGHFEKDEAKKVSICHRLAVFLAQISHLRVPLGLSLKTKPGAQLLRMKTSLISM